MYRYECVYEERVEKERRSQGAKTMCCGAGRQHVIRRTHLISRVQKGEKETEREREREREEREKPAQAHSRLTGTFASCPLAFDQAYDIIWKSSIVNLKVLLYSVIL